jgi:ATP/maltotriose-dependent transcriptional regulator MalT
MGLAMEGIALVSEGDVDKGMRLLDESTATALTSEMAEFFTASWALCYLIYACERVRDYDRAGQWCEKMKEYAERVQCHMAMGVCRAHYGAVLIWRGRWDEAEAELSLATADLVATRPAWAAEAIVRLAELRRRQGRVAEAMELFGQASWHPLALQGLAEIALERGDAVEAEDLLERIVRNVPSENKTQRVGALEVMVRVYVAQSNHAKASEALIALQSICSVVPTRTVQAATNFAAAVVARAAGDYDEARRRFEDAADLYQRAGAPYETACTRIELARVLASLGRRNPATREAGRAVTALKDLGAINELARASAVLGELQPAQTDGVPSKASFNLTAREIDVLRLVAQGCSDKEIASNLIVSEHTVHRHIANILTKLAVPTRAAAVAYAARAGLL